MPESILGEPVAVILANNPINILHVDDDEAFSALTKECLELQQDICVESVHSVKEALELLKEHKFEVIVSDYDMPDENGLQLLKEIKARGIATPFILFTGKGREEIAVKALELGAFRYLNKSGDPAVAYLELSSCIRQASNYAKTQNMLKESEKRFRAVFDSSIDAILVVNDLGDIVYSNKAAKSLNFTKKRITRLLNKYFERQFTAVYEHNMTNGFNQLPSDNLIMPGKNTELILEKTTGEKVPVELSFSAFTENGQWFGVSIIRDTSDREKQKRKLEQSRQTLKALFAYNPEAIAFVDKDFQITQVNHSFIELFGFSYENIKGKKIADIIVPESLRRQSERFHELVTKIPLSISTKRKKLDGSIIDVVASGGPLVVDSQVIGAFLVYKDITATMIVQNELEKSLTAAKLLNEKIKVLGSFTRHDIRNKLGLIQGNVYLARKKCQINSDLEKFLHNIDDAIKNATDILDFAKTYEMLGIEEVSPKDVGKMVQNAIALFSDLKAIKIVNQCIGLEVYADSMLTQVFYNLIDNTLKYGEKTTTIKIWAEKFDDQSLKLYYKDDGVGVDKNSKEHIFQKGFGKGTGYGLYLIRKICELYGWTICETGESGQGAIFEFTIPLEKVKTF